MLNQEHMSRWSVLLRGIASIPAPLLKRGPGNHCLRVGGFNSKFVSKTLCILSRVYYQEYATATGDEIRHWAFSTSQQCVLV